MGVLLERIKQNSENIRKGSACSVGTALTRVPDPDDQDDLRAAMADRDGCTGQAIADELQRLVGVKISEQTINRHRRRQCRCA